MKLLIIGAGTFSTEVEELARLSGFNDIAFVDDHPEKAVSFPVIGGINDIERLKKEYDVAIVALGNNTNRIRIHNELEKYGYTIPCLVHPTAYVSPDAVIEPGCIIRAMSVVGRYAKLGKSTILNIGAKVDHHCEIGEACHLQINSVVRASKTVAPLTWLNPCEVVE